MGSENFRGAVFMVVSMIFFAFEDMLIKLLSQGLPYSEVLGLLGVLGFIAFGLMLKAQGGRLWTRELFAPAMLARNGGEIVGSIGLTAALALADLATTSAIIQALPLAIALGAALFLGEPVGWRRWSAIGVGFFGVLMVVRPGLSGFQPISMMALVAVIGLAVRDLATRRLPKGLHSHQVAASAFLVIALAGGVVALVLGQRLVMPSGRQWLMLLACMGVGVSGYTLLVAATRVGEASALAPYRYARLVFALALAFVVFHERPDAMTLIGAAVIVVAGCYTMWREAVARHRRLRKARMAALGR